MRQLFCFAPRGDSDGDGGREVVRLRYHDDIASDKVRGTEHRRAVREEQDSVA